MYAELEEVGHSSSNVTKTSHAPICNVLNIRQLAICIDRAVLLLAKVAIGKELVSQASLSYLKRGRGSDEWSYFRLSPGTLYELPMKSQYQVT